ncbi:hypothetical protein [Peptoniphilus sp. HCN-40583]|uniref:hypothetical protein n=1 Tax=Peptoniphilus sp. HCN-40583 TaxID=3134662 RepID=UPI0030BF49CA
MYFENTNGPTTGERLQEKLSELNRYDEQIRIGEWAKEKKPELLIEIQGLCRELMEEEEIQ